MAAMPASAESRPLPEVVHDSARQRFVADIDGHECLCVYRRDGQTVYFTHTEVPPALQGRGLAAHLVRAALAWARDERLAVQPRCSYVAAYLRRHPEAAQTTAS